MTVVGSRPSGRCPLTSSGPRFKSGRRDSPIRAGAIRAQAYSGFPIAAPGQPRGRRGGGAGLGLSYGAANAAILFALWFVQFLFPTNFPGTNADVRVLTGVAFVALAVAELVVHRREIHPCQDLLTTWELIGGRRVRPGI